MDNHPIARSEPTGPADNETLSAQTRVVPDVASQATPEAFQPDQVHSTVAELPPAKGQRRLSFQRAAKIAATLVVAMTASFIGYATWQYYVATPWTRNGAVRVQVANVAPQVSGQIVELRVADNQFVHKGDVLYVVDPADYQVARDLSKSQLDQLAADFEVKKAQSERREHLTTLATTPEERQIYQGAMLQAKAAYSVGGRQLVESELKLSRTQVVSPVNGYVTNLLLRAGDFAVAGQSNIAVIDADSFWIDGYFEETKMPRICVGYRAEAKLIGYDEPIIGHVDTITRGISVSNAELGVQGLPNVNPIYTWVRLAQRVPVRIRIDSVPPGVPLVSGLTATVTIRPEQNQPDANGKSMGAELWARFDESFRQWHPRPECLVSVASTGAAQIVPTPGEAVPPTPEQLVPELTSDGKNQKLKP